MNELLALRDGFIAEHNAFVAQAKKSIEAMSPQRQIVEAPRASAVSQTLRMVIAVFDKVIASKEKSAEGVRKSNG